MRPSQPALTLVALATALATAPGVLPAAGAAERVHELQPGTTVPYDPGYTGSWLSYDVVRPGDKDFFNGGDGAIRVLGRFDADQILCMHYKGGFGGCYVGGKTVTDLGYGPAGRVVTTDPVWAAFAPVIRVLNDLYVKIFAVAWNAGILPASM